MKAFNIIAKRCLPLLFVSASVPAMAADLGTFTVTCGGAGGLTNQPLNGTVGDTFRINAQNAACFFTQAPAGSFTVVDQSNNSNPPGIGFNGFAIVTLATAGNNTFTAQQNGTGFTFNVTAAPGAVVAPTTTAVPTLSEWGLILLSGVMALVALTTVRRRRA